MHNLLIATGNAGKRIEIQNILHKVSKQDKKFQEMLELVSPALLGLDFSVVEDGESYAENAAKKAIAYSRTAGLITLADDSGLEVKILNGEPGIHSARYSPKKDADDADRRAYLLKRLLGKPRPWTARFHCTVAIATPDGSVYYSEGNCAGEIIDEERGLNGFGYDPIFMIPERNQTMAELSIHEKNRISHRAQAVQAALPILKRLFTQASED